MKESEIRPKEIFEEYLRLSANDAVLCFSDAERSIIECPGCGSNKSIFAMSKQNFEYQECENCKSVFQSPRPSLQAFEQFYNNSKSSKYWADTFFPAVAEARRDKIFKPRVDRLIQLCRNKKIKPDTVIDIGAGYGIFLEEWRKQNNSQRLIAVEPSKYLAEICRNKELEVIESIAENVQGIDSCADLLVCFEVLEHVYNPLSFIETLSRFVKPGGYMMISTLGINGFDIQVLWEKSNSISPPHHINFMSIKGFESLFQRAGLTDIEIITPGLLDVDIVKNACINEPDILKGNRFVEMILTDQDLSQAFQSFLINNKLSSHTWVFAKKITLSKQE